MEQRLFVCWEVGRSFLSPDELVQQEGRLRISEHKHLGGFFYHLPFPKEAQDECRSHCPQRSEASRAFADGI